MKRYFSLLLAVFLIFSMAGCDAGESGEENLNLVPADRSRSDHEGVELRIAEITRDENGTRLEVEWISNSKEPIIFGASYIIERLEGEQWVSCAAVDDLVFNALAYELAPWQVRKEVYHPDSMFDLSKPGTYRFRSDCSVEGMDQCNLWAEFTVGSSEALKLDDLAAGSLDFSARYIHSYAYRENVRYPQVLVIQSAEELEAAMEYGSQRVEDEVPDPTAPEAMYDAAFFESNYLIVVVLQEGSGSIRHEVETVEQIDGGQLAVSIDVIVPEVGTCDMAQWYIILELDREHMVASERDVQVYLDGALAWGGSVGVPHISWAEAEFTKPPAAALIHSEGSTSVHSGGFSWFYQNSGGTISNAIADHKHPLQCQNLLEPVTVTGDYVKLEFEDAPDSLVYECWPDTQWNSVDAVSQMVDSIENSFYVRPGGYIYRITATWNEDGSLYHGTADYLVYIVSPQICYHPLAQEEQTVENPVSGYCGNIQTTLHIGDKSYTFMGGHAVTLTHILVNLDYDPNKLCNCLPEYTVDTEFASGYDINLSEGYARCDRGQADLTQAQIDAIAEVIAWAKTQIPDF